MIKRYSFESFQKTENTLFKDHALSAEPSVATKEDKNAVKPSEIPASEMDISDVKASESERAPTIITFTEAEMEAAKSLAHQEGLQAGYQKAQEEYATQAAINEEAIRHLLEQISIQLTIAAEKYQQQLEERTAEMAYIIKAIAEKIVGQSLQDQPLALIHNFLQEVLPKLLYAPQVTVQVPVGMKESIIQTIETLLPANFPKENLVFQEEASLSSQDCQVLWPQGNALLRKEELWQDIEKAISHYGK